MTQTESSFQIQWEMLREYPAETAYELRADGKKFLPIEYYRKIANQIFGPDNWGVIAEADSVRFLTVYKPDGVTVSGQLCVASVKLLVTGCEPKQAVGFAPVQFARDSKTKKYLEEQQLDVYTLAIRSAVARGIKEAFKQFGQVFEADLKGRGKKLASPPIVQPTQPSATKPLSPVTSAQPNTVTTTSAAQVEPVVPKAAEIAEKHGLTIIGHTPQLDVTKADPWSEKCNAAQLDAIDTLLAKLGKDKAFVLNSKTFKAWGYTRLDQMTKPQAEEITGKLSGLLNSDSTKAS